MAAEASVKYATGPVLASLEEAIDWARARWHHQRTAPIRLHQAHATDGALGGPRFSAVFIATLDASPTAKEQVIESISCGHPTKTNADYAAGRFCSMCSLIDETGKPFVETGRYERPVERYRYPMTQALSRLKGALSPPGLPRPASTVMALASYGWDTKATAEHLNLIPPTDHEHMLRCLRQLHHWYQEAPLPSVSYIDKSEAQRNAEQETWTAA
jgi:hypothetical protein